MKYICIIFFCVTQFNGAFSQRANPVCQCPKTIYAGTKADTVYHLSNNIDIALCGYQETELIKGKTLYREFVLSVCGSNKIIKFWSAVEVCNVRVLKDTLFVETLVELPIGKTMNYNEAVWTIERVYFVKDKLKHDSFINPALPKYNSTQIAYVLSLFYKTKDQNGEKTGELIDKLFISALSGSDKAKNLLINFRNKFTLLDGVYFEQYDDAIRMLNLWDKKYKPNSDIIYKH